MEQNKINPMMEQLVLSFILTPISHDGTVLGTALRICRQTGLLDYQKEKASWCNAPLSSHEQRGSSRLRLLPTLLCGFPRDEDYPGTQGVLLNEERQENKGCANLTR